MKKGAEVVRMYQTLFGKDGFRRGLLNTSIAMTAPQQLATIS